MNKKDMSISADFRELEHQIEKGNLFAHTVLTEQIMRINESESYIYGLIDYLIQKGIIQPDELKTTVDSVRKEIIEKKEFATLGVALRVDGDEDKEQTVAVNCEERLHICNAVCCRLRFALSVEEIETGRMKWELGKPYYNRHHEHGYCHQMNLDKKCCNIYENRPTVCSKYSCANDKRIWKDFEKMELNQEWINTQLNRKELGLVEVFMN
ncbi:MAG: YkgJ family cysteine cluster protein [Candidatus Methanoperedens sp.]|nr:YkgJ family cysteine cluster protein [Candidatus Methanoperedens sp.]